MHADLPGGSGGTTESLNGLVAPGPQSPVKTTLPGFPHSLLCALHTWRSLLGRRAQRASQLAAAETETGLSDYGDDSFVARFAIAVEKLRELGLDRAGERAAAGVCHWLLSSRLQFFHDHESVPGLADEVIERPLFATGEPRSGTTLLHQEKVDSDSAKVRLKTMPFLTCRGGAANGMSQGDERRLLSK